MQLFLSTFQLYTLKILNVHQLCISIFDTLELPDRLQKLIHIFYPNYAHRPSILLVFSQENGL